MSKIKCVEDVVHEEVERAFKKRGMDREDFEHDLMCFNDTGIRCAVVLDRGDTIDKHYVIIGLKPNLNEEWKEVFFKKTKEGIEDGIDAMLEANSFLHNHD